MLAYYYKWAINERPHFVPCFSLFSVLELRRRQDLYHKFIERFDVEVPWFLLKSHEQLLESGGPRQQWAASCASCPTHGRCERLRDIRASFEAVGLPRFHAPRRDPDDAPP
jgi:hypothetical protein